MKKEVRTKVYRFKYCLTKGVEEIEVELSPGGTYGYEIRDGRRGWNGFNVGKHARPTRAEALKEAEKIRLKRIASLKKQLKKLEALRFHE